jgi:GT2 family glycosyltransferase
MLQRCLESIINQKYPIVEILVLDNGSDEPLPKEFYSKYPVVKFYRSDSNMGFAAGNNFLFSKISDCRWVALVNSDAYLEPKWLSKMISATKDYPEYSFFASRLISDANHEILDGDGDTMHISGLAWREGHGRKIIGNNVEHREIFSPCAAASLYKSEAFDSAGGFDKDFFCYFEDVDLGFRLRLAGYRCLLVPEAVAFHVGSASTGGQRSDFAVYHGHRNMVWTYVKNMPGVLFWLLLPVHIVLNLITVICFLIGGQGLIIFRAKKDALLGITNMWRKRRDIQKNRTVSNCKIWQVLDKRFLKFV